MNALLRNFLLMGVSLLPLVVAQAEETVLIEGPGIKITADDLNADIQQRIPLEARAQILSKPETIFQLASNLYVRRALAAAAKQDGVLNDPINAAKVQLVQDRLLSDMQLAKINEASKPDAQALERLTESTYRADPKKFESPEQISVRHILIAQATENAKVKAEKLLAELKAGADFEALAKEHSADPGSASRGGELGFFARGRMVPAFEEAAFALKQPGDLSGVVETQFGFHILRLEARKPVGVRPYGEVRDELRKSVLDKLQNEARVAEAQRLSKTMQPVQSAIDAFAASQR